MSESVRSPTPDRGVFERIRHDILRCRLAPDSRLPMDALRARYDVGLSPLREALMRLEAEGLVLFIQKKGFRVPPVSREHLMDLGRVRSKLECIALRWSIEKGDVAWEADILGAFHRLSPLDKVVDGKRGVMNESWSKEHRIFHSALTAACGSPVLISMLDTLYDHAERYVALSIANHEQPRDDVIEHKNLMKAALERDADKACALCQRHVERTVAKVAASIGS